MRVVTLDLETSISEPWEDGFPPLPLHVPEIACMLIADGGELDLRVWDRAVEPEPVGLARIGAVLDEARRLVTFNGRGFDMPLLSLRAMVTGTDWSWWETRRHRFPGYNKALWHYDILEQLGDYGAARGLLLDRVAKLLGLGKQGMHGADVAEALRDGRRADVAAYCANDCLITYVIYLRWYASHGGDPAAAIAADRALEWAKNNSVLSRFYA
jgi:hypothetical protein